jgi:hypothetical protein
VSEYKNVLPIILVEGVLQKRHLLADNIALIQLSIQDKEQVSLVLKAIISPVFRTLTNAKESV